ncbi:MAG: hypothetical protein K8S23_16735 [Candidatus Cloacimonetes bacterium]|nr:hypothetical protein [Candidatus Cloacimonadota bacterium]
MSKSKKYVFLLISITLLSICALNLSAVNGKFDEQEILTNFRNTRNSNDQPYGDISTFNPATTYFPDIAALTETKFVIVYRDYGNSGKGTAIIGETIGDSISWGNEYVYNNATTNYNSVAIFSDTKFVITYQDYGGGYDGTAIIGEVTGTEITFGNESDFRNSVNYNAVTVLNDSTIVVAYNETDGSHSGRTRIGTVAGNSITGWGAEAQFHNYGILDLDVSQLDSDKFVLVYSYQSPDQNGFARIGTVNENTITLGDATEVNDSRIQSCSVSAFSDTMFIVAYRDMGDSGKGTVRLGSVNEYEIDLDSENVFYESVYQPDITILSDSLFAIVYRDDNYTGNCITGKITGSSVYWYNAELFTSAELQQNCISTLTPTEFIVAYYDTDNSNYGKAVKGFIDMKYRASIATQDTNRVIAGTNDVPVIGIEVITPGQIYPFSVTEFNCNSNGTTNTNDISNATLYYTGTDGNFSLSNQFGSVVSNPNGSFSFTDSQQLEFGTNYFWLAYDVSADALDGNFIDAECTQITVNDSLRIPTVSAPAGARNIVTADSFPGTALDFDDADDYVNVGNDESFDVGNVLTIEGWVKPDDLSLRQGIFSTRLDNEAGSFQLEIGPGSNGSNSVAICGVGIWIAQTEDDVLTTDEWFHIAYTRSGINAGDQKIYINGEEQTLITDANYEFLNNSSDKVIASGTNGGQLLNGILDETRIWNIVRSQTEIRENMYLPLTCLEDGLVAYWQYNEGSGSTTENVFTGADGTLHNMIEEDWINSDIPFADGVSNSQTETAGTVDFIDTDLAMNFTSHNSAAITVTRLNASPNGNLILPAEVFDDQYWIVNRFGSGSFETDITFTLSEDISSYENSLSLLRLYSRQSNAIGDWNYVTHASSISAIDNSITFDGITEFSQFIICRHLPPDGFPGTSLEFDGSDDYVEFQNDVIQTGVGTIEYWVGNIADFGIHLYMSDDNSDDYNGFGGLDVLEIHTATDGDGKLFFLYQDGLTSTGRVELHGTTDLRLGNELHHIAVSYDSTGDMKLYVDGELEANADMSPYIFAGKTPAFNYLGRPGLPQRYFGGIIDELRTWNVVRTEEELRENMYLPLTGVETGLVSYWQFNDGSESNLSDFMEINNGTLNNMTEDDWIDSTIPFGSGFVNTQEVSTTGNVIFTDTDVEMDFTAKTGTDTIVVSKLDLSPNINPTEPDEVFDAQYWIVNRYGSGTFDADLTFTISEDLTIEDESNPEHIALFTRSSNADSNWIYLTDASSVIAATDEATFEGITEFSQFIIGRWIQVLDIPQNVAITASDSVYISWDAVSGATSYKIYSSDDPYAEGWGTAVDSVAVTSWTSDISEIEKMFYYVTASSEGARSNIRFLSKPSNVISKKVIILEKRLLTPKRKTFQKRD